MTRLEELLYLAYLTGRRDGVQAVERLLRKNIASQPEHPPDPSRAFVIPIDREASRDEESAAASYAQWAGVMERIRAGQVNDAEELDPSCSRLFTVE